MPRTEAGMRLLARLYGGPSTVAAIEAIEAEAAIPDRDALARALPDVARSLWATSKGGEHHQVWFDEDVLRHFNEWADDTADAIVAALKAQPQPFVPWDTVDMGQSEITEGDVPQWKKKR